MHMKSTTSRHRHATSRQRHATKLVKTLNYIESLKRLDLAPFTYRRARGEMTEL